MRALLFLTSFILALPGIALAIIFLVLGQAIATHSLLGFLGALLHAFVWIMPWGLLALLAAVFALLIGGISGRFRWLASTCVAVLAIASGVIILVITYIHGKLTPDQLPFHIPAVLAASICIWLAQHEWPRPENAGEQR